MVLLKTGLKVLALLLVMALCILVVSPYLSSRDSYRYELEYMDEKLSNVNRLALGSTSISYLVSLLPDDHGTPIASELAKISSHLLVVISALMLEKFLLTVVGFVSFTFVIPAGCFWGIVAVFVKDPQIKKRFMEVAIRLMILGICFTFVIPIGCRCGRLVEDSNRDTIQNALAEAVQADSAIEQIEKDESRNALEKIGDFFTGLWGSVTKAFNWAKQSLSNYMSSVAVMLVTTIVIPLLIFFAFFWVIRFFTRKDFTNTIIRIITGPADRHATVQEHPEG